MNETLPKVSIITVCFNAVKYLEITIQSIIQQTYPNIEYIIVDGNSNDGTLTIIDKYKNHISKFISEPDQGLYDAMNKGIDLANGEYIWFMNAGDIICESSTLENVMKTELNADVYYGDTIMLNEDFSYAGYRTYKKLPEHLTVEDMKLGMVVCHQSMIVKKVIAPKYDLDHRYSADIDWTIKVLINAKSVRNTKLVISKFLKGGFSSKQRIHSLLDRLKILIKHFGILSTIKSHFIILLQFFRIL